MQILVLCAVRVVPDLIFFTAQRSENMFYIFTSENITFSKYAFYFINHALYFITLYIIKYGILPLIGSHEGNYSI